MNDAVKLYGGPEHRQERRLMGVPTMTMKDFFDACTVLSQFGVTGFTVKPELYLALFEYIQEHRDNLGLPPLASQFTSQEDVLGLPPPRFRGMPFNLDKEYK
jgi:hypothetical protein